MNRVVAVLLTSCFSSAAARADFVVTGLPGPPHAAPQTQFEASTTTSQGASDQETALPHRRLKPASGFGHHVPLAFAVRQIAPPGVAVTYGPGARAEALVSWKGGAPWTEVLRAAVKPLGLRVLTTEAAVQIRK